MKIAIIDMGTNTFHLILVEVSYDSYKITYREKTSVKIGKGGISKGHITDEAIERAVNTLLDFKRIIEDNEIDQIHATATSAIRNARNGLDLLDLIKEKTGISARIISGREEAEYIYFGVNKAVELGDKPVLIMDIGGGSIEFVIANNIEIYWLHSYEIGGQRMIDRFHRRDPIDGENISLLEEFLSENLTELFEACSRYQPKVLIGSSGTFDTISDIFCHQNGFEINPDLTELPFATESFEFIYQQMISKNREERLKIPGMIPMRVDMIVVAFVLIKFILENLSIRELRISAYALKEGVLLKTIDALKKENILKPNTI